MLKQSITYTNFNNEQVTEVFLFNLTRAETIELEATAEGGLSEWIKTISVQKNPKAIIDTFKHMIAMSYGEKTADGRRFVKSEEISQSFLATEAYSVLFTMLISDAAFASNFTNQLLHNPDKAPTEVQKTFTENNAPTQTSLRVDESFIETPPETEKTTSAFGDLDSATPSESEQKAERLRIARRKAEMAVAEAERLEQNDLGA